MKIARLYVLALQWGAGSPQGGEAKMVQEGSELWGRRNSCGFERIGLEGDAARGSLSCGNRAKGSREAGSGDRGAEPQLENK